MEGLDKCAMVGKLLDLVYELPQEQRHVVLLKYPLDSYSKTYSDEQIGRLMKMSSTWVRSLRKKAFATLRKRATELGLEKAFLYEFGSK